MLPVPPNVAPTISLELDVDDGEVENYEVGQLIQYPVHFIPLPLSQDFIKSMILVQLFEHGMDQRAKDFLKV